MFSNPSVSGGGICPNNRRIGAKIATSSPRAASNQVSGLSKFHSDFFGLSFFMSDSLGDEAKSLAGDRK